MTAIRIDRVTIDRNEPRTGETVGTQTVTAYASHGGQSHRIYAWSLGWNPAKSKLAQRLIEAIKAGKVLTNFELKTRLDGSTYVFAKCDVIGRTMNADLRRLGF
jgi:hypothetical protein